MILHMDKRRDRVIYTSLGQELSSPASEVEILLTYEFISMYICIYPIVSTEKERMTKAVTISLPYTEIANLNYHFPLKEARAS